MAFTLAQLKQMVRDKVYGQYPTAHPFVSVLAEALDATETAIDVPDGTDWAENDVLEIMETDEQCLVRSVATNTLTVIRGWNGTTAAIAADAGTILKNPRFTGKVIEESVMSAVYAMEDWGIHKFNTGQIAYDADKRYFELSETDIAHPWGVLALYYVEPTTLIPRPLPFKHMHNLSTAHASYTTGLGIIIQDWGQVSASGSVTTAEYTYAQTLATTTLANEQAEIVVLGATVLVLGGSIVARTHDPGARTDRTVQPGQEARDVRFFQSEYFVRLRAEAAHLAVQRMNFPGTVRLNRAQRWRH